MHRLLRKLARIRKVQSIDLIEKQDGTWDIRVLTVSVARGKLSFDLPRSLTESDLHTLNKRMPAVLTVSGVNVMIRQTPKMRIEKILDSILPGSNSKGFYIENVVAGGTITAGMIRNSKLESLLIKFASLGICVVRMGLGIEDLEKLSGILNEPAISTRNLRIPGNDSERQLYIENGEGHNLLVGEDELEGAFVGCFAAAVGFFTSGKEGTGVNHREEAQYRLLNKRIGLSAIGLLFAASASIFIIASRLHDKVDVLQEDELATAPIQEQLAEVENSIALRTEIISRAGLQTETHFTEYADRLAQLLPPGILLNAMELNPVSSRSKDAAQQFDQGRISVMGESNSIQAINLWMNAARQLDFVISLELERYENSGDDRGEFSIEIRTE